MLKTKYSTIGEEMANEEYNVHRISEEAVEELSSSWGCGDGTVYVFEDGSGVYEKRRGDFYPISVQDVEELRTAEESA